jgi:hypothetical protein
LVELLVVIAIIGVLVALLLPAIQAAREAARRTQCTNNLKNLALGVLNYHDTRKVFPAPVTIFDDRVEPMYGTRVFGSWAIDILPFIEQQNLHQQFQISPTVRVSDNVNREARGAQLAVMLCPSDVGNSELFTEDGGNWARGNYGLNGFQYWPNSNLNRQALGLTSGGMSEFVNYNIGIGSVSVKGKAESKMSIARLTDGTTNTIMLGEMRIGLTGRDRRGVWAMGLCGSNFHCRHAANGVNAPNSCGAGDDDIDGIQMVIDEIGRPRMRAECMDAATVDSGQSVMRSLHPGGIFIAMADGSARFISDFIESGRLGYGAYIGVNAQDISPDAFRVWQRLNIAADGMLTNWGEM